MTVGFEIAVLKAVDELLPEYEFKFHGVSDEELLIGTESGKYQVGTKGAWITDERKKKLCDENDVRLLYYSECEKEILPDGIFSNKDKLLKEVVSQ